MNGIVSAFGVVQEPRKDTDQDAALTELCALLGAALSRVWWRGGYDRKRKRPRAVAGQPWRHDQGSTRVLGRPGGYEGLGALQSGTVGITR